MIHPPERCYWKSGYRLPTSRATASYQLRLFAITHSGRSSSACTSSGSGIHRAREMKGAAALTLAYDRNLMGIDPEGLVHIGARLLAEHDGPMLREGLQGFHGAPIAVPRNPAQRPDPERLAIRFRRFGDSAA